MTNIVLEAIRIFSTRGPFFHNGKENTHGVLEKKRKFLFLQIHEIQ